MGQVWGTIRGYVLWSYERGTIQYDVMVTLILLFVFLSPRVINFNDKPIQHNPQPTGVLVTPDPNGGFVYEIESAAIPAANDSDTRNELLHVIEPISGSVSIKKYEPVKNFAGHVVKYRVWVNRE